MLQLGKAVQLFTPMVSVQSILFNNGSYITGKRLSGQVYLVLPEYCVLCVWCLQQYWPNILRVHQELHRQYILFRKSLGLPVQPFEKRISMPGTQLFVSLCFFLGNI